MIMDPLKGEKDLLSKTVEAVQNVAVIGTIVSLFTVILCIGTVVAIRNECILIERELNGEVVSFDGVASDIWTQLRGFDVNLNLLRVKRQTYGGYGGYAGSAFAPPPTTPENGNSYGVYQQPSIPFRPRQMRPTPPPPHSEGGLPPQEWTTAAGPRVVEGQPGIPPSFKFPPAPPAHQETPPQSPQCKCETENKCPAGPPGPKGAAGDVGHEGPSGIDGIPGIPGDNSVIQVQQFDTKCFTCPQGPPGSGGPIGRQGMRGMRGAAGQAGMPGRNGNPGAPGGQGPEGVGGEDGPQGEIGVKGEDGTRGSGIPGSKGVPGIVGEPGAPGNPGNPGMQGLVGPPGQEGPPGAQGLDAEAGPIGEPGEPGDIGKDAEYCPCPRPDRLRSAAVASNQQQQYLFGFRS